MSRPWIKVHVECLDNPKIVTLSLSLRGIWYTTLLIAERYNKDGLLPSADRFAVMAHTDDETINKAFLALAKKGLLDASPEGYRVHDWAEWQVSQREWEPKEQVRDRVQRYRDRMRENTGSATGYAKHRDRVYERDGYACVYCGRKDTLCLDHLIPGQRGGDHEIDNLVTACKACNSGKSGRVPEEAGYGFARRETAAQYAAVRERLGVTVMQKDVTVTPPVTVTGAPVTSNESKSEMREEETREELTQRDELTTHLAAEPRERVVYLPAFEVFWKAYGKFVGKKEAHQYWLKLKPDTVLLATILAAVEGQRGGRKWLEGYQPDAVRWLRGEHWNDIPEAPRVAVAATPRRTSADERMERIQTDGDAAYEIITQMEARKHGRSDLSPTNRLTGGALPADRDERDASRVVDFPRRSIG